MIALIDLDPIVHIISAVQWKAGNRDNAQRVQDHVSNFVENVLKSTECDEYIMFFQDIGHDNFRKLILPEYKSHRKSSEAVERWKPAICEQLIALDATPLYEIESDDAISLWAEKCRKENKEYLIVENDKDLAMIPGKHYNPFKRNTPKKTVERRYEFSAEESLLSFWQQVVTGDPTDMPNEKCGIHLVGPVKARKGLQEVKPVLYPMKAVKMYTDRYGYSVGLRRMAITYDMVKLLLTPSDDIYESTTVLKTTPRKYSDSVEELFENKKPSDNLFE